MELEEFPDAVAGPDDILLQGNKRAAHLAVLSPFLVGNKAAILVIMVLEHLGETPCIPLVRFYPVHFRFRHDVRRDDHAVDPILGKLVIKVKTFETCFVDEVNHTLRELVPEITDQYGIFRFHGYLVDHHLLRAHRKLPRPFRILESHKNFLLFRHVLLYPIRLLRLPPFLLFGSGLSPLPIFEKEGSLSFICGASNFYSIETERVRRGLLLFMPPFAR